MKFKIKTVLTTIIFICIPLLVGFVTSRYGPWWGFKEQASVPDTPSDGVKIYADSNNNLYSLHENGSSYKLNVSDPNGGLTDPTIIGTLSLGSGSVTDSSGAISFGDENLTTTGSLLVNTKIGVNSSSPVGKVEILTTDANQPFIFGNSVLGSFEGATTEASNRINAPSHGLTPTIGDLLVITSSSNNNEGIYYISDFDATYITLDGSYLNTVDSDIDFTIFSGGVSISKEDGAGVQYMVGGFLQYRSLFLEYGMNDVYSRPQLHLKKEGSILRLGSFQGDGDGIGNNQASNGIVAYGEDAQGDTFDADNYSYARITPDRFGLYNDKDGVYAGYLFRIDLSSNEFYLRDNSGNVTFNFDRSTGDLTTTGNITNSWIPKVAYSVGSEVGDVIAITVTVANYGGTTIAKNFLINLWLSDTSGGIPTSTAPDGGGTAADGWVTSDGTEMEEITAEIYYQVLTGFDGDITISIKDDDADNDWYLCGEVDGAVYCSAIINHAV